jgi:hypothetical protein
MLHLAVQVGLHLNELVDVLVQQLDAMLDLSTHVVIALPFQPVLQMTQLVKFPSEFLNPVLKSVLQLFEA